MRPERAVIAHTAVDPAADPSTSDVLDQVEVFREGLAVLGANLGMGIIALPLWRKLAAYQQHRFLGRVAAILFQEGQHVAQVVPHGVERDRQRRPAFRAEPLDLRHDAGGHHVALEHVGIATEGSDAFLDARAARVVETDHRCADLDCMVHDLADFLGMCFRQRAAEDREVLREDEDEAAVDGPVADHDTVAAYPEAIEQSRDAGVELVPSVPALFGFFHSDGPSLLRSPKAHLVVDDMLRTSHPAVFAAGDAADVGKLAKLGGNADKSALHSSVGDFYLTNPIARASATMAECSALTNAAAKSMTAAE